MAMQFKSSLLRWGVAVVIIAGLGTPVALNADGETGGRDKPWANLVSEEAQETTRVPTHEQGMGPVNGEALPSIWERSQENPDFLLLSDQVDSNDERLLDARNRVIDLQTMIDEAWEELNPSVSQSFQPSGSAFNFGPWSPAISTQTTDFRQDRNYEQEFTQNYEVYETNKFTNERRLSRTFSESETRSLTESRVVDVANNPNGGANGWSNWSNYGSRYSCSTYSPARSTVTSGQRFTQTRSCYQRQESLIYYLIEGNVEESNRRVRSVRVSQTRSTTGTKPAAYYVFKGSDRSNPCGRCNYRDWERADEWNGTTVLNRYDDHSAFFARPCTPGSRIREAVSYSSIRNDTRYSYYECEY